MGNASSTPQMSSATEIFRTHCGDLLSAIQEPDVVAWKLFSKGIISDPTLQKILVPGQATFEKNSIILEAVKGAITYEVLDKFATVLDEHPPADIIASKIRNDIVYCYVVAKGRGKERAMVGRKTSFELTTTHSVPIPPNLLSCQLTAPNSSKTVECTIAPTQLGGCIVHYTPAVHGPNQLKIAIGGNNIPNSPFTVHVFPSPEMRGRPLTTITGLSWPWGVVVSENEEVVVSEWWGYCISVFNREGKKIRSFGSKGSGRGQFNQPTGIALTCDGHLLVADGTNHQLQVFTLEGNFITSVGQLGHGQLQLTEPRGITVHPSGKVFIADSWNYCIQVLNTDLTYSHMFGSEGSGEGQFKEPFDIAWDSHGDVYVTDHRNNRVQKFTPDGRFISSFGSEGSREGQLKEPTGICIDFTDTVYVSEEGNHRVSMFDSCGRFLKCFGRTGSGEGELRLPYGLAVDNTGNLYVCDYLKGCVVIY